MGFTVLRWFLTKICGGRFANFGKGQVSSDWNITSSLPGSRLKRDARTVFNAAIESVLPPAMVANVLRVENNQLSVEQRTYNLNRNVHVVGFGKAVIGMVRAVEDILDDHIVGGIASVPVGIREALRSAEKFHLLPGMDSRIKLMEGAPNNIPDAAAHRTAGQIAKLVASLGNKDLLIILISGGGSALLPSPKPPVTLQELIEVTQLLSHNGATIHEMNALRRCLEQLKGGGLSDLAHPAQVLTLALPDVIGNSFSLIASGPTMPYASPATAATQCSYLLERMNLHDRVPESVWKVLDEMQKSKPRAFNATQDVYNVIIGSNTTALSAAAVMAQQLGYVPHVLSAEISGEARTIGAAFATLGFYMYTCMVGKPTQQQTADLINTTLVEPEMIQALRLKAERAADHDRPLCILAGGETTVTVKGKGRGGRNQEMALAAALAMKQNGPQHHMLFFSAGSDGQDGPTNAAGAMSTPSTVKHANALGLKAAAYLQNNDSHNFFLRYRDGVNLIMTGLTGTNVMDIHILLLWPVTEEDEAMFRMQAANAKHMKASPRDSTIRGSTSRMGF